MPFLLTLATLHVRLAEAGASKSLIGFFTLITLPYTLKFAWAPVVDLVSLPFFTRRFGQRRGWLLVSQLSLIPSIALLGIADPKISITLTAIAGSMVAFCSATQDIVYEAYRIEILKADEIGPGASASMLGYRLGIWLSGAGALYLAEYFSWVISHAAMSLCIVIGIATTLSCKEPAARSIADPVADLSLMKSWLKIRKGASILFRGEPWLLVLIYIFFYKLGDTTLNVMTAPFLIDIGFSKAQIAHVAKSFGIAAMIAGSLIGSFLLARKPLLATLMLCSMLQVFSCAVFCLQAFVGYSLSLLMFTVAVESLTCGLGTASLIAYFSKMCKAPYTASHYALLSSFASLFRVLTSNIVGAIADGFAWEEFYALMGLCCLPSFFLLLLYSHRFSYKPNRSEILATGHRA